MQFRSLLMHAAGSPIRRLRRRIPILERLLHVELTDREAESVNIACAHSHVAFGAYYHWYLQKLLISKELRRLNKASTLRMLTGMDRTDYSAADSAADDSRGLIVATPHHGHYILSITALAERLRTSKKVLVFYANPKTHSGNEIFERMHAQLFSDAGSGVEVIHDTRAGMVRAIRGLQNGAVVVIMPDAYKNEEDTFLLPFCGKPQNVMFGTAALARKTGAAILPMVSLPLSRGLGFRSTFGAVIEYPQADQTAGQSTPADITHMDYRTTLRLFQSFEEHMRESILYWQYVRSHYIRDAEFPDLSHAELKTVAELLLADPRINIDLQNPIRLD